MICPYANIDEVREASGGILVQRFQILTTRTVVYKAWEPCTSTRERTFSHSTITTFERTENLSAWYGRIGTGPLSAEVDALPRGDERLAAYDRWRATEDARSYEVILAAFPEAAQGEQSGGEVTLALEWWNTTLGRLRDEQFLFRHGERVHVSRGSGWYSDHLGGNVAYRDPETPVCILTLPSLTR